MAEQACVALGDEEGPCCGRRRCWCWWTSGRGCLRPDSLGAYLTWSPHIGRTDAERNCVSNIRPEVLGIAEAAHRIAWLVTAARERLATGVALKDASDVEGLPGAEQATSWARVIETGA